MSTTTDNELQQIRSVFQGLQTLYQTHLSKVDPVLIHDLLVRELETRNRSSSLPPFYIVEIRTVQGMDQEKMKNFLFEKTGFLPSIRENGTQYTTNMRLTLELLKDMCEAQEDILWITGDYTGGISGR